LATPPPDDAALADFATLYRRHYRQVRAVVLGFRLPAGAVDDAIQDTFISAWENIGSLEDPKAFAGWLTTIARNRCLRELRRKKTMVVVSTTDHRGEEDADEEIVLVADDVEASFHWEHSVALIRELIAAHEGEPRATVARLFYLEKVPVKEIAERLAMKTNTVLSHLHRFRSLIADAAATLFEQRGIEIA
jgi:RNA polymerase sigma-70 factor (ECF subfamily)